MKNLKLNIIAHINKRRNTQFVNADVLEYLKGSEDNFDIVIADPPRSGMEKEVVSELLKISPRKVIYISCEPSTLVRDVKILTDAGYKQIGKSSSFRYVFSNLPR